MIDADVPVMNAAGTAKTFADASHLLRSPVGNIMLGSYTLEERGGNGGQDFATSGAFALNSIGLPSPAMTEWKQIVRSTAADAVADGKTLWVSVAGFSPEEFGVMADAALTAGASAVELNLGCPNIWDEGSQKQIFSYAPEAVSRVLAAVSRRVGPLGHVGVKLSPILDLPVLERIADIVLEFGVAFVSSMNTVPNCFALDADGRPAIRTAVTSFGGLSGPAVKPIALGQVRSLNHALQGRVPVVGVGGIRTGRDVHDFLSREVGAALTQVATAYWEAGPRVFAEILSEYLDADRGSVRQPSRRDR